MFTESNQPISDIESAKKSFRDKISAFSEDDILRMWNDFNINYQDLTFDGLNTIIEEFGIYKNDFIDIMSEELEKRFSNKILSMESGELNKIWGKLKKIDSSTISGPSLEDAQIEFYGVSYDICLKIVAKEMLNRGLLSKRDARGYGIV